jgi:hypothetical protein
MGAALIMMRRRTFLQSGAAACLAACTDASRITGGIVGANHAGGHLLRDLPSPPVPARTIKTDVVVLGGGMSGLIAALRLHQAGIDNITLLDLETAAGGNARSGSNTVSAYPWGAHYVPVPGADATEVRRLFEEFGIITGHDAAGRPVYNELFLCADQQERLFTHGVWQEGLGPALGVSAFDRAEMSRFTQRISAMKTTRGRDGRRVFVIPVDASSRDPDWLALDAISMEAWLARENFSCEALRWYVNYCCRDDYGAGIREVSAWAGLHYFASRDDSDVLTWPEGNGWLVQRLLERMRGVDFRQAAVYRITQTNDGVLADGLVPSTREAIRFSAKAAVCALPRFVAQRVVAGLTPLPGLVYSPWAVANLTWHDDPPPAWDNVLRDGKSLGYVVATHQSLHPQPRGTVLTWYQALDHLPPAPAREEALAKPWSAWRDEILADLRPAHPEVNQLVSHLDVMLWGHGMIRPVPGFISGSNRAAMKQPLGRIAFAHTDMSGISIFEEACTRGADAARTVLKWLGKA